VCAILITAAPLFAQDFDLLSLRTILAVVSSVNCPLTEPQVIGPARSTSEWAALARPMCNRTWRYINKQTPTNFASYRFIVCGHLAISEHLTLSTVAARIVKLPH